MNCRRFCFSCVEFFNLDLVRFIGHRNHAFESLERGRWNKSPMSDCPQILVLGKGDDPV